MNGTRENNMSCFIISFMISSMMMPVIIYIARRFDITDKPGGRKAHKGSVPILGGMGIYIAFILSILISMDYTIDIQRLIIYSGLMLVVGILDDIKAIYKLALETISALLAVLSGVMLHIIPDGMWWSSFVNVAISIVWMVGITNAVNIVDGLDGLAGGIAFIGSCAFLAI
jgi:UDP-GlcNAc:undecaprenyl-phosphate/decaprenyl-phosphate GlcNAc-1-phosphate transferase